MGNMELNEGHEQELMRLHEESGRLMIACQDDWAPHACDAGSLFRPRADRDFAQEQKHS